MRKTLLFILIASIVATLAGCGQPAPENAEPAPEGGRAERTTNEGRN